MLAHKCLPCLLFSMEEIRQRYEHPHCCIAQAIPDNELPAPSPHEGIDLEHDELDQIAQVELLRHIQANLREGDIHRGHSRWDDSAVDGSRA